MKNLFFVGVIFFCMSLCAASEDNGQGAQKLLNKFFSLSGELEDCHFYDAKFLSADKTKALCVLGLVCNAKVRKRFKHSFLSSLNENQFPSTYEKMRIYVGGAINKLLNQNKQEFLDDQGMCALILRVIYLGPKTMLSFWAQRPKVDCCTHVVVNDTQPYMFKSLQFETDSPIFQDLDPDLVKNYAQKNDMMGFIESISKKNPQHKLGIAVNYQAWKMHRKIHKKQQCLLQ